MDGAYDDSVIDQIFAQFDPRLVFRRSSWDDFGRPFLILYLQKEIPFENVQIHSLHP